MKRCGKQPVFFFFFFYLFDCVEVTGVGVGGGGGGVASILMCDTMRRWNSPEEYINMSLC